MSALRRGGPWVALLVLAVAAAVWTQALRTGTWSPDEEFFVQLTRVMGEQWPGAIVSAEVGDYNARGVQRLLQLLLVVPLHDLGGVLGFGLARAIVALVFASAAVPAYLLARGVRLSVPWALVAAALAVVVPWAVVATSFLTEPLAYPLVLWSVWGAWRACLVPGWRSDLLALALVALATLARTGSVVLVALAPVAAALFVLSAERRPGAAASRLRRDHPLLAVVLVAGIVFTLVALAGAEPLDPLFGQYTTAIASLDLSPVPAKFARETTRIVVGLGVLPVLLGAPWLVRHLRRRADPADRALALVCSLGFLLLLATTLYSAEEERYLMAAAPLLVLPGVAALARRDVPPVGVALTGAVIALAVWRVPWPEVTDAADFQINAARAFFSRVVLGGLSGPLPGAPQAAVALGLLALTAIVAVLARRRVALVAVVAAAALLGVQLVQTGYVVTKRAALTEGTVDLEERVWVDRRAGDEDVAILAEGQANGGDYDAAWRDVEFWNERVQLRVGTDTQTRGGFVPRYSAYHRLDVDPRTGTITILAENRPPQRLWLVPTLFTPLVLADQEVLADSKYLAARMVRTPAEPRALLRWSDVEPDGWLTAQEPTGQVELFPAAHEVAPRPCLQVLVVAPANYRGVHRYTFSGDGVRVSGALEAAERRTVRVPLRRGLRRLTLRTQGTVEAAGDRRLGLQVPASEVVPC